jgi:acyl dehydratase
MSQARDVFSDASLAKLRARIGVPLPHPQQFNEVASKDAIRHFAHGCGDTNPLWTDGEYARKTRYGSIVAPPVFLYSCEGMGPGAAGMGLPGAHALWAGDEWEWFQPVRINDQITYEEKLSGLREVRGKFAERSFEQISEKTYRNQRDEIVARCLMTCRRFTRYAKSEKGEKRDKYQEIDKQQYTQDELSRIYADYDREERQGANPRFWEDVQVGDELSYLVKGPLTVTDIIAFLIGLGSHPFIRAHGIRLAYDREHPTAAITNSHGVPDAPQSVHWDDEVAQKIGVPAAFDMGNQRIAWLCQVMTNWIGDDGFLKRLRVQLCRPNIVGDTCWCRGRVTGKYIKGGEHLVECELWADNQRGERSASAVATALLPSQG